MDETTAPSGPSPAGIFAEARRQGMAIGLGALALARSPADPVATVEFSGLRMTMDPAGCCIRGGEHPEDLNPAQLMRLGGFLAGIADAYRMEKDPLP